MRIRLSLAALLAVVLGAAVFTAPQTPAPNGAITIQKLIDIRHPSQPVWSRDGRRVAFLWDRAGQTDLYLVPSDGSSAPVAVTTGGAAPTGAAFAADGALTFTVNGQPMRIPVDGGPAVPYTPPAAPGRLAVASRDGARVAYVATAEGGNSEIRVRNADGGGEAAVTTVTGAITALGWTPDGSRITFSTGGGRGQQIFHDVAPAYSGAKLIFRATENVPGPPADTFTVAVGGGGPVKYTAAGAGGRGGGAKWLNGREVLVDRTSADFKRRTISVVNVLSDTSRVVQEDVKDKFWSVTGDAQAGSQASPDGKWILFLSDRDGWDHLYVMAADGAAGSARQITKGKFEAWRPTWSPDGTRIAFDANEETDHGRRHIGIVTLNGDPAKATVRMLTSGRGADIAPAWSPDGTKLLYQHSDPWNSADYYVVDAIAANAKPVRLTNSMPASIDKSLLTEPELVRYKGPDGRDVPAYLFVPKNLDRTKKHPAIVWIHGDGVNQNYDGWHVQRNYAVYYSIHQYFLQRGYVVIAPDYRGSIGYGAEWREAVHMDVGGKDFQDAGLAHTYLRSLPYVDGDRIGVWGLSYGGFFTLLAVTEMPTAYRAAVDVAGVVDYALYYDDPYHGTWTASRIGTPDQNPQVYAQASPVSRIDRLQTPLLILHGTADVNVPFIHSVKLVDEAMKKGKGSLVEFMAYPGEFHYFTRAHVLEDAWRRVSAFFDEHLTPGR